MIAKDTPPTTTKDTQPTGRINGKFAPGNKESKGFPNNARVQHLRSAMLHAVTPEDIATIITTLVTDAKNGNLAAAKLVLSYTIGQPHQTVQPDRTIQDDLESQNKAEMAQELIAQRARFAAVYNRGN